MHDGLLRISEKAREAQLQVESTAASALRGSDGKGSDWLERGRLALFHAMFLATRGAEHGMLWSLECIVLFLQVRALQWESRPRSGE